MIMTISYYFIHQLLSGLRVRVRVQGQGSLGWFLCLFKYIRDGLNISYDYIHQLLLGLSWALGLGLESFRLVSVVIINISSDHVLQPILGLGLGLGLRVKVVQVGCCSDVHISYDYEHQLRLYSLAIISVRVRVRDQGQGRLGCFWWLRYTLVMVTNISYDYIHQLLLGLGLWLGFRVGVVQAGCFVLVICTKTNAPETCIDSTNTQKANPKSGGKVEFFISRVKCL